LWGKRPADFVDEKLKEFANRKSDVVHSDKQLIKPAGAA